MQIKKMYAYGSIASTLIGEQEIFEGNLFYTSEGLVFVAIGNGISIASVLEYIVLHKKETTWLKIPFESNTVYRLDIVQKATDNYFEVVSEDETLFINVEAFSGYKIVTRRSIDVEFPVEQRILPKNMSIKEISDETRGYKIYNDLVSEMVSQRVFLLYRFTQEEISIKEYLRNWISEEVEITKENFVKCCIESNTQMNAAFFNTLYKSMENIEDLYIQIYEADILVEAEQEIPEEYAELGESLRKIYNKIGEAEIITFYNEDKNDMKIAAILYENK